MISCSDCGAKIRLGRYRIPYCPTEYPEEMFMHCAECENPLDIQWVYRHNAITGFGGYCITCDYTPSLQDTYLSRLKVKTNG